MKIKVTVLILATAILLTACSPKRSYEVNSSIENEFNEAIKTVIDGYSRGILEASNASVTSQHLIVTENNGEKTAYELPEKEFYISIAPFITETHP